MRTAADSAGSIEYVVGTDARLPDLLSDVEVRTLLDLAVRAGVCAAAVADGDGDVLWSIGARVSGSGAAAGVAAGTTVRRPLFLEGEEVGSVTLQAERGMEDALAAVADLVRGSLALIMTTNLKRMLTAATHTKVVDQSYEELLAANLRLRESEGRYRELAECLDRKVREKSEELGRAYARLLQQEKMASVGQLAAGVAHEINNPLGFISSNLDTFGKYLEKMKEMLAIGQAAAASGAMAREACEAWNGKWAARRLDFLLSDAGDLLRQSREGAERVRKIVSDLKGFSHVDDGGASVVDLNAEIDRTLSVLAPGLPPGTEVVRDYRPLPGFSCQPALVCQAFLNILTNAAEARREGLTIAIVTRSHGDRIRLDFTDNGPGIRPELRRRIFEPFFTTKEVGKGTGMGLTVAYEIVSALGGTIEAEGSAGGGTTFRITLPLGRG